MAGRGQGAYGVVGENFIVPVSEFGVAKPLSKKEVAEEVDQLNVLGAESAGVCKELTEG